MAIVLKSEFHNTVELQLMALGAWSWQSCISTDILLPSVPMLSTELSIHFLHYTKRVLLFSTKMGGWQIHVASGSYLLIIKLDGVHPLKLSNDHSLLDRFQSCFH